MNSLLEKYLASSSCVLEVNLDTILVRSVYNKNTFSFDKEKIQAESFNETLERKTY